VKYLFVLDDDELKVLLLAAGFAQGSAERIAPDLESLFRRAGDMLLEKAGVHVCKSTAAKFHMPDMRHDKL